MEHKVKLKDGTEIVIRELTLDDLEKSVAFFQTLPREDRVYLRVDVTKRENVEQRIKRMQIDNVHRFVAVAGDRIVADGALEMEAEEWEQHMAELRLIVAHDFQRKGLGLLMARELFTLAASKNVEEVVARFMAPQKAARNVLEKLGFHQDTVLHDYVRDIDGNKRDLVLMRCDLKSLWEKLEDYIANFDWKRTR